MKHIAIGENHLYSKAYSKGVKFVGKYVIIYVLKDLKSKVLQKNITYTSSSFLKSFQTQKMLFFAKNA